MRVPRGRYHVAHRPGMYRYHVASPMRYFFGFDLCRSVVVVTGTWQIVVVVVGATVVVVVVVGATVVVVVVVSPGTLDVDVGSDDVVVGGTVDVVGVHVGLRFFFTVVVVTGLCTGLLGFGRLVETVSVIVACQRTRVPAAGDWRRTTIHLPSVLPGPRVLKNRCARFMTAIARTRDRPMRRGTRRGPWGFASDVRTVAWKCQGTTVPGLGDWPTASFHVPFELPGPVVTK